MLKLAANVAVMVVDSPEWAWSEVASEVICDEADAEFYAEHAAELADAGARLLTDRLRAVWTQRGADIVAFVRDDDFDTWADADEQAYLAAWQQAAARLEFSTVVEGADLRSEYVQHLMQ